MQNYLRHKEEEREGRRRDGEGRKEGWKEGRKDGRKEGKGRKALGRKDEGRTEAEGRACSKENENQTNFPHALLRIFKLISKRA